MVVLVKVGDEYLVTLVAHSYVVTAVATGEQTCTIVVVMMGIVTS